MEAWEGKRDGRQEETGEITPGCVDRIGCVVMWCDTIRCTMCEAFAVRQCILWSIGSIYTLWVNSVVNRQTWVGWDCGKLIRRHEEEDMSCRTALRLCCHRPAQLVVMPMVCTKLVFEVARHVEVRGLGIGLQVGCRPHAGGREAY